MSIEIVEFGDALIRTRDLDPTYVGLVNSNFPRDQLHRWLLAYWCFYHCGVASYMSEREGVNYWSAMRIAAENTTPSPLGGRWPRAAERRHFRSKACISAVNWLSDHFPKPEDAAADLYMGRSALTEEDVMHDVQKWPMFGPWIAFKVADMLERCAGAPIKFSPNSVLMYHTPTKALLMLSESAKKGEWITTDPTPVGIYNNLLSTFMSMRAPPNGDRYCGPQEVETVLCKWKSMKGGHYHIGKDIHDHRLALAGWGESADRMLKGMPQEV